MSIVEGKKSVDVGVELCYCNEDLCNLELGGTGTARAAAVIVTLLAAINTLT